MSVWLWKPGFSCFDNWTFGYRDTTVQGKHISIFCNLPYNINGGVGFLRKYLYNNIFEN